MTKENFLEQNEGAPEAGSPAAILGLPPDADIHAINDAFRAHLHALSGRTDADAERRRTALAHAWESLAVVCDEPPASPETLRLAEDAELHDAYHAERGPFTHWLQSTQRDIPTLPRDLKRESEMLAEKNLFTYHELNRWIRAEKLRTIDEWDAGILKIRSTYEIGNVLLTTITKRSEESKYRERLIEAATASIDLQKHIRDVDAQRRHYTLKWAAQIEERIAAGTAREHSEIEGTLTADIPPVYTDPYALIREVARLSKPKKRKAREEAELFFFAALEDQQRSNAERRLALVRRV